ncbi:hypothetical protein [Thermogymnomonas acidicola]|uniref:hypothetical protein n=1 Tax=Thermogymnomonas acidicola TaxID=399579 RepID=UPI00139677BD|nr:hypothetical protein [Thermogymnomonas acidicola]
MPPLYTDLESLASGYRSFMYICRFDAERVRGGEESLFLSSREPLSLEGGSLHALDEVDGETPVVVSYDFVSEAYPSLRFRRSGWPQVMLMEPDEVMHGNFVRERPPLQEVPCKGGGGYWPHVLNIGGGGEDQGRRAPAGCALPPHIPGPG